MNVRHPMAVFIHFFHIHFLSKIFCMIKWTLRLFYFDVAILLPKNFPLFRITSDLCIFVKQNSSITSFSSSLPTLKLYNAQNSELNIP